MGSVRIARRAGLLCLGLAVCAFIAFIALTQSVAPGGDQFAIAGFGIGEGYQRTYIPRRALSCAHPNVDRYQEVCRLTVDGRELVATVMHDDHSSLFPACRVSYGERDGSCWAGNRVIGGASYALASRVGLGLSEATLADLAQQYRFATWYEADWQRLGGAVAVLMALCLALATFLLLPQRLTIRAMGALSVGGVAWVCGALFTIATLLFAGLID